MVIKIEKVSMVPAAKVLAVLHAVVGLVLAVIVTIVSMFRQEESAQMGAWSLLIFPVLNGGIGFLLGIFIVAVYNFIAQRFGGIEFEAKEG